MDFNPFASPRPPKPLLHIGSLPIDLTSLIIAAHLFIGLAFSLFPSAALVRSFAFSPSGLLDGKIWTLVTYPFVHGIDLWLVIGLLFFWLFGRELEATLGTRRFALLYVGTAAGSALGTAILSPLLGDSLLLGQRSLHFAVFVGFATAFPQTRLVFDLPIKWFVYTVVGLYLIQHLGSRDWAGFAHLALAILAIYGILGSYGIATLPAALKTKSKQATRSRSKTREQNTRPTASANEVDRILDKISSKGFDSLNDEEKRLLRDHRKD